MFRPLEPCLRICGLLKYSSLYLLQVPVSELVGLLVEHNGNLYHVYGCYKTYAKGFRSVLAGLNLRHIATTIANRICARMICTPV